MLYDIIIMCVYIHIHAFVTMYIYIRTHSCYGFCAGLVSAAIRCCLGRMMSLHLCWLPLKIHHGLYELPSVSWIVGKYLGWTILYGDSNIGPTRVPIKDPCFSGLPEILTVANVAVVQHVFMRRQGGTM